MNRILEYSPAPEEAVVSRILVMVHKSIDTNFPDAQKADRQFTKTVFSSHDSESTAINRVPNPDGEFEEDEPTQATLLGSDVDTGELPAATDDDEVPDPPTTEPPTSIDDGGVLNPMREHLESEPASKILTKGDGEIEEGPDWISRILAGLIVAGLILLIYVLFMAQPS